MSKTPESESLASDLAAESLQIAGQPLDFVPVWTGYRLIKKRVLLQEDSTYAENPGDCIGGMESPGGVLVR